jgi:hypothetical protein
MEYKRGDTVKHPDEDYHVKMVEDSRGEGGCRWRVIQKDGSLSNEVYEGEPWRFSYTFIGSVWETDPDNATKERHDACIGVVADFDYTFSK